MSCWVGHRRLAEILRKWPKVCLSDQPSGPMISLSDRHKNVRFKEEMIENQSKHEPVCTLLKIGLSSVDCASGSSQSDFVKTETRFRVELHIVTLQ